MNRFAVVFMGTIVGLCAAAAQAQAFAVSYSQKITSGGQQIQSTVKMRDDQFRMESIVEGTRHIVIQNDEGIFSVMPSEGIAMKLPALSREQQGPVHNAGRYGEYLEEQKARKIGTETVNGYPADVYEFIDREQGGRVTVWVWTDKQFPVKLVRDTPAGQATVEMTDVTFDAAIPDSAFELPAGVKVMASPAMPGIGGGSGQ